MFVEEIQQLYTAFSSNLPSPLPPLTIQFADYAYWQNEWFKGEEMRRQVEYWKNKMEGAPALLELPTDRVRPAIEGNAGHDIHFDLDKQLTDDLKAFAKQHDVTLFMVLHAAYLILLSRYSRQDDIVIGTPTANRSFCEVEPLIGFFVNTLLLRVDVSGDPSFAELLGRVKQTDIEAFEQQQVPFEHLLEELKPERSLSYSPWFQVLFVLQNTPPWDDRQIKDLEFSDFGYEVTTAKFDISLDMREDEGILGGLIQYKTELFDAATIERMVEHYRRLLTAITRDPSRRLSEYRLTDAREEQALLTEGRSADADYPLDKCIHQLIEDQARRSPEAIAVCLENESLTYAQLNHRANVLAHFLRQKGVIPGAMVGVCMQRSVNMIVSMLAVLKAGGAYVPLDPNYPTDRLQFMIEDSGLCVLLTSQQVYDERSLLLHERVDPICLDRDWAAIEREYDSFGVLPPNGYPLNSGNVAYVIYTSGSTGRPKGVQIEHRSLVNYACWARDTYEVAAGDRFLQFASISFDAAAEEIYTTLITGATLVLRTEEMIASADTFMELLDRWKITVMELPTAYWHQWVADLVADPTLTMPTHLRVFAIGGERALPEKVRQWHRRVGARPLVINTYGPTETTIASTYHKLPLPETEEKTLREVPIGRPVANTQTYILDERMCPVPVGIPG